MTPVAAHKPRTPAAPRTPALRTPAQLETLLGSGNYRRISRDTGLSLSHVSRVLRGLSGVTLDAAVQIACAAGVTVDELQRYIADQTTPVPTFPDPSDFSS